MPFFESLLSRLEGDDAATPHAVLTQASECLDRARRSRDIGLLLDFMEGLQSETPSRRDRLLQKTFAAADPEIVANVLASRAIQEIRAQQQFKLPETCEDPLVSANTVMGLVTQPTDCTGKTNRGKFEAEVAEGLKQLEALLGQRAGLLTPEGTTAASHQPYQAPRQSLVRLVIADPVVALTADDLLNAADAWSCAAYVHSDSLKGEKAEACLMLMHVSLLRAQLREDQLKTRRKADQGLTEELRQFMEEAHLFEQQARKQIA